MYIETNSGITLKFICTNCGISRFVPFYWIKRWFLPNFLIWINAQNYWWHGRFSMVQKWWSAAKDVNFTCYKASRGQLPEACWRKWTWSLRWYYWLPIPPVRMLHWNAKTCSNPRIPDSVPAVNSREVPSLLSRSHAKIKIEKNLPFKKYRARSSTNISRNPNSHI